MPEESILRASYGCSTLSRDREAANGRDEQEKLRGWPRCITDGANTGG